MLFQFGPALDQKLYDVDRVVTCGFVQRPLLASVLDFDRYAEIQEKFYDVCPIFSCGSENWFWRLQVFRVLGQDR